MICMLLRISCCHIHQAQFIYIFSGFCLKINNRKILNINTKYRYKHQYILALHNKNLCWCLHLLRDRDLLFNKLQSSRDLKTKKLSDKHNFQYFCETIPLNFSHFSISLCVLWLDSSNCKYIFKVRYTSYTFYIKNFGCNCYIFH